MSLGLWKIELVDGDIDLFFELPPNNLADTDIIMHALGDEVSLSHKVVDIVLVLGYRHHPYRVISERGFEELAFNLTSDLLFKDLVVLVPVGGKVNFYPFQEEFRQLDLLAINYCQLILVVGGQAVINHPSEVAAGYHEICFPDWQLFLA